MKKPRLKESDVFFNFDSDCVKGEYVLLHNGKQHFWAQICSAEPFGTVGNTLYGIVQSRLQEKNNLTYNFGDLIQFNNKHIFDKLIESEDQPDANTHESHLA